MNKELNIAYNYQSIAQQQNRNFNDTHYSRLIELIAATANMGFYSLIMNKNELLENEITMLRDDGFIVEENYSAWVIKWGEID